MRSTSSLLELRGKFFSQAAQEMLTNIYDEAERRFEACPCKPTSRGRPSSFAQLRTHPL